MKDLKRLTADAIIAILLLGAVIYSDLTGMKKAISDKQRLPITAIDQKIEAIQADIFQCQNDQRELSRQLAKEKNFRIKQSMNSLALIIEDKQGVLKSKKLQRQVLIDEIAKKQKTSQRNVSGVTIVLILLSALSSIEKKKKRTNKNHSVIPHYQLANNYQMVADQSSKTEEKHTMLIDFPCHHPEDQENEELEIELSRDEQILKCLEEEISHREIAKKFKVSTTTIQKIKNLKNAQV